MEDDGRASCSVETIGGGDSNLSIPLKLNGSLFLKNEGIKLLFVRLERQRFNLFFEKGSRPRKGMSSKQ